MCGNRDGVPRVSVKIILGPAHNRKFAGYEEY